jgi:tetratricopeptide (TPR) repeat protein
MAFGFGFNKQKVLSAAEKFVQQGKLQNAIAEYEKIRKYDDKDLTVANTIGDLYARLGDSANAIECFKTVGDAYAAQGFTVKGIAMYKKITKLQPSVDGSLKLAELYTQQGLFNDARAQYLQVAEDFLKGGELDQAIRLFQKVLEMDPENVAMRVKLAEVYVRRGKKKEAWEIFSAAAESLRSRGSLAAAEDILQRMLTLDPGNSYVLLMRGRAALDGGHAKQAIEYLEKASDIDSHADGLRDLLKAYLETGDLAKAAPVAEKLVTVHNDPEGLFLLAEGASKLGHYDQALEIYARHADRLLATDTPKLLASLHTMIAHVREDGPALEKLMELLKKSGESTHANEVAELLAHASVKNGNLERARDLYQTLAESEPQNSLHLQNYQQMVERLKGPSTGAPGTITAEEGALIVEELETTAPVIDQPYPDHVAVAVRSAVTEADLFLSYNLPEKALAPLLGALPDAPHDVRLNQRLAALHTRARRFREAAVCCRTLETAYHDAGHPDDALRYGELAERYEKNAEAAGVPMLAAAEPAPAKAAAVAAAVAAWPGAPMGQHQAAHGSQFAAESPDSHVEKNAAIASAPIHEMAVHAPMSADDLSTEWEETLTIDEPEVAEEHAAFHAGVQETSQTELEDSLAQNPEIAETVDEIKFYLEHFMTDQARSAFEKLEILTHSAAILDPLRTAIEAGVPPTDEPEVEIAELEALEPVIEEDEPQPSAAEIAPEPTLISHHDFLHEKISEQGTGQAAAWPAAHLEPALAGESVNRPGDAETFSIEPAYALSEHDAESVDIAEPADLAEPVHADAEHAAPGELTALVADLEASIGPAFTVAAPAIAETAETEVGTAAVAPSTVAAQGSQACSETKSPHDTLPGWPVAATAETPAPVELPAEPVAQTPPPSTAQLMPQATSVGGGAAAAPAFSARAVPVPITIQEVPPADAATGVDLSEMFSAVKQELEEEAVDDDPETHYSMGVAFREMGLLDEAIAELQKVGGAIERGQPFAQKIQTYTWLAQCFLEKGVPEAAIRWYEKALNLPGLDSETRLALHYELGSACEQAQDKTSALHHFTYVFGANIDYRDVAERIQALSS